MRLLTLIILLSTAAATVEASACKLPKPASASAVSSASSSSSSSTPSPSPSVPCNTNLFIDPVTNISLANAWHFDTIGALAVTFPDTCMNDANNDYPSGSCVNLLMAELPGNGHWTAATFTRTVDTTVGSHYYFNFVFQLSSDQPNANTGSYNALICSMNDASHTDGWVPIFNNYPEDTDLNIALELYASASTTTITCVLQLDTTIDMTIRGFRLSKFC
ncbi:MAG: hypothetical protein STHCBS139747_004958 [Sporothrix thermara]